MMLFASVVTLLISSASAEVAIDSSFVETPGALSCLPHLCSKLDLPPDLRSKLLAELRRELDLVLYQEDWLARASESSSREEVDDAPEIEESTFLPSSSPPSRALLVTVGGPARAESIVQAHVLMDTVRVLHGDDLPIEVWHAGEPGMDQACAVWARLFEPFQCHHAHRVAVAVHGRDHGGGGDDDGSGGGGDNHDKDGEDRGGAAGGTSDRKVGHRRRGRGGVGVTALARALGVQAGSNEKQEMLFAREGGQVGGYKRKEQLAPPRPSPSSPFLSEATVKPALEWVRGWPIKPLALLLTSFDHVIMLDADSIPLVPPSALLDALDKLPSFAEHGNLFWPDITRLATTRHEVFRQAFNLTAEASSSVLSAESGQLVLARRKCLDALRVAWVLNAHPATYALLHGDKDTFKLAFDLVAQKKRQQQQQQQHRQRQHQMSPSAPFTNTSPMSTGSISHPTNGLIREYQQVATPPLALGGLGPQTMADGTAARGGGGSSSSNSSKSKSRRKPPQQRAAQRPAGGRATTTGFCGQSLVQRSPQALSPLLHLAAEEFHRRHGNESGSGVAAAPTAATQPLPTPNLERDPQLLFVHRVLAKYNLMNLMQPALTDSWDWITTATQEGGETSSQLTQHGWCMEEGEEEEEEEGEVEPKAEKKSPESKTVDDRDGANEGACNVPKEVDDGDKRGGGSSASPVGAATNRLSPPPAPPLGLDRAPLAIVKVAERAAKARMSMLNHF